MAGHFERLTDSIFLPRWLVHEHEARYAFCRALVEDRIVLDCGSGEGKGARAIAAGRPRLLVAVDRSLPSVALARGERVVPMAADAERLPIQGKSIDVVIALEVIEHMEDPEAFLREVARVLRDGGTFICSTPNRIVRNPSLPLSGRPLNPWHLREWTADEFRTLLGVDFETTSLFGQEPQSPRVTRFFQRLAAIVSRRGAAILRQLIKFRLLILRPRRYYDVQALGDEADYEFIVGVCSIPRRSSATGI
ncbi:MAG: hypothetical protein QOE68_4532 [Thermoanaerobaculia bacterium]|jgi:SAM-dependent methyltransferase|nr:hypothetical protein [Thermoanaerobaculia bacterium]